MTLHEKLNKSNKVYVKNNNLNYLRIDPLSLEWI
jgi:hypothetical protein